MFWKKDPDAPKYYQSLLEKELELAIVALSGFQAGTNEYAKQVSNIERLHKMVMAGNQKPSSSVSKDTLVNAGANLVGIAMILKHEWAHPISSKALGFVHRLR